MRIADHEIRLITLRCRICGVSYLRSECSRDFHKNGRCVI